jgi:hypothetical protein
MEDREAAKGAEDRAAVSPYRRGKIRFRQILEHARIVFACPAEPKSRAELFRDDALQ